jgi:hypothetical protein
MGIVGALNKEATVGIVEALGGEFWVNVYAGMALSCLLICAICALFIFLKSII